MVGTYSNQRLTFSLSLFSCVCVFHFSGEMIQRQKENVFLCIWFMSQTLLLSAFLWMCVCVCDFMSAESLSHWNLVFHEFIKCTKKFKCATNRIFYPKKFAFRLLSIVHETDLNKTDDNNNKKMNTYNICTVHWYMLFKCFTKFYTKCTRFYPVVVVVVVWSNCLHDEWMEHWREKNEPNIQFGHALY